MVSYVIVLISVLVLVYIQIPTDMGLMILNRGMWRYILYLNFHLEFFKNVVKKLSSWIQNLFSSFFAAVPAILIYCKIESKN